ncbi:MAG TPA: tyrosine-protein phosphatase [Stenotrophomonas sp.]|jgi:protein-tyrosine phosphatase
MKIKNQELALALALALPVLGGCAGQQVADQPAAPSSVTTAATTATAATDATAVKPAARGNVQPTADDAQRVIALQGAWNVRSFAGLQGANGPIPAAAFVRTADLGRLTPADRDALAAAGVKLDIDLRTGDEQAQSPDLLAKDARFGYERISLMGTEKMDLQKMMTTFPDSLGEAYVQWLGHSQPQFKQVFQSIAAQQDGTVLFHCTAGKDRTGIISGLLLDLAGVPKAEIVHNYAISAHYLEGQPKDSAMNAQIMALIQQNPEIGKKMAGMAGTAPENMEVFIGELHRTYGGAEGYLKAIGLSEGEIRSLKVRLGQAG